MLTIKVDTKGAQSFLKNVRDKAIPYAVRQAVNVTGKAIKEAERKEMARVFDRPTPRTLNSVFFKPATKQDMTAYVWIKDQAGDPPPIRWLFPQVVGGRRGWKAFEKSLQYVGAMPQGLFAVPGSGMPLDQYGNAPSGLLRQILSQLRAQRTSGFESRTGGMGEGFDRKRRGAITRMGFRVFAVPTARGKLPAGVYAADLFGRNVQPLLIYVRTASYRPRLDFYGVGQKVARAMLQREFSRAFEELASRFTREGVR